MTVYFTADLHHRHSKVILTRRPLINKVGRELVGIHSLTQAGVIQEIWRRTLTKNDQLWILGDISAGGKQAQLDALQFISSLKTETGAQFHLIAGNHDGVHPLNRDAHKWFRAYANVFDSVSSAASKKIAGRRVCLSHFPYDGDHTSEDRHTQWRLRDEDRWLLHGHTHQDLPFTKGLWTETMCEEAGCGPHPIHDMTTGPCSFDEIKRLLPDTEDNIDAPEWRTKMINVGVDAWDFKPVALETIADIITELED